MADNIAESNVAKVALIRVPKQAWITIVFLARLDSTTMVFSSGIAPRLRFSITLLARGFTIFFVLNIPTFLAVEKSTGMFSPSQYGTLIPPDLTGSTFILSDLSSTLRILHCIPRSTKTFPGSP